MSVGRAGRLREPTVILYHARFKGRLSGRSRTTSGDNTKVLELMQAGGWLMVPIVLCSVVAMAIVVERFWALRRAGHHA